MDSVLTSEMNNSLLTDVSIDADVSIDEVKSTIFQLGPLKSPGPDGFSGIFFIILLENCSTSYSSSNYLLFPVRHSS